MRVKRATLDDRPPVDGAASGIDRDFPGISTTRSSETACKTTFNNADRPSLLGLQVNYLILPQFEDV
jgi:hypothetical protein